VIADSSIEAMPSITSPSLGKIAGLDKNYVPGFQIDRGHAFDDVLHAALTIRIDEPLRPRVGARLAQGRCLRLSAALGHGFREIRKQQAYPEPEPDLKREFQRGRVYPCHKVPQVDNRRQHAHDLDHEHDRIADHESRVELAERLPDRRTDDRRIEQGTHVALRVSLFHWLCLEFTRMFLHVKHFCLFLPRFRKLRALRRREIFRGGQNRLPARIARCSSIGPSARAGK
jgi:hypothetical protein